jgi:uncharacterized membrane protein
MQGIVSGFSFAAGYGFGVALRRLWRYLGLPSPPPRTAQVLRALAIIACLATALPMLWLAADWQDSLRRLMELDPVEPAEPLRVALVASAVFCFALLIARAFRWVSRIAASILKRFVPPRVSYVLASAVASVLFWSIANGVLIRIGLRFADASYQQLDALVEDGGAQPSDPNRTGSPSSMISWKSLGRAGREFVSSAPSAEDMRALLEEDALAPVRVFAGLNSAVSPEARARLALLELKRVRAFERAVLVLVTPTGTGWVDPAAIRTVEALHRGDVASVAVQYSYLASWLALLTEPGYGADTARALFREVYDHWSTLPREGRPRLYLHGLSLGALNSDHSADLYDVIGDPFHGALWSGPPFSSETWRYATANRRPGSPAWLPRFRDGSIIRFTNQRDASALLSPAWGPMRIVYLQYASDPITFFSPQALYRRPEWLDEPRGPDVSPRMRWFPIVTFLQLIIDMPASTNVPAGYGHVYAAENYLDAWRAVTDPPGWSDEGLVRLKARIRQGNARDRSP